MCANTISDYSPYIEAHSVDLLWGQRTPTALCCTRDHDSVIVTDLGNPYIRFESDVHSRLGKMSLEEVLVQVRMQLEEKIKRQLSGLQGFVAKPIYNSLMPLHVEMLTEPEAFELVFLKDGDIELKHGQGSNSDVRIESDAQTLRNLFQNPSAELFKDLEKQNGIRITALTRKGRDAEAYIRRYLSG
jgi:hypothetical protein